MNILEAIKTGQGIAFDPPKPGTTAAPCSKCGCPLFWRYNTVGPLFCAECFQPDKKRVKVWKLVMTIGGAPQLVCKALADAAGRDALCRPARLLTA